MTLNDLLTLAGIEPKNVLVYRHSPSEPELAKVLPWLAAERPDVFNAYQQTQNERAENAMLRASHVAAFIGHEPRRALFVGLYENAGANKLTADEFSRVPEFQELMGFGMSGFSCEDVRPRICRFDLVLTDFNIEWKGKLTVDWPPGRLPWRWADRNTIMVSAILEETALVPPITDWSEINLTWDELSVLPSRWQQTLSQWRGIYLIFDESDGRGYVGSAYGTENLLGRWKNYAATGHGGNRRLRQRDPSNFRFTILQRVSPDTESDEVIRLESTWKERLHTRAPHGLNDN